MASCLQAIERTAPQAEVMVVDKGLPFAEQCNLGADLATGEVVVVINDDCEPQPGWLEPLLRELEDPDVAIVGSQLRYPDGRLQHAGVGFRGVGKSFEAFNIREPRPRGDVEAVTGACLAIRRELFLEFGGFDERYKSGYEDIDLCLRVRAAGYRIVYAPDSIVIHLESQSSGRFAHVRENVALLQNDWGSKILS